MQKGKSLSKGLHIAILAISVFYLSGVGVFITPRVANAASIGSYDQCSNDDGDGYASGDTGCRWTNGNLQSNNSTYYEGDATVQRVWLDGFEPGSSHSVTLQYGTTKGGKHAYDFLTSWNWSENWVTEADLCQDIDGCSTSDASENTLAIPSDPNGSGEFETGTRNFVMRGGSLTGATTPSLSGSYGGDSETTITVNFDVDSSGDMCTTKGQSTTCGIALFFGAHVAETANWQPFNDTTGATSISGSPYHVALFRLDGASVGNRDNQMQTGAILTPALGTLTVYKQVDTDGDGDYDQGNNFANTEGFAWTINGSNWNAFGDSLNVLEDEYTVSENNVPGYQYVGWNYGDTDCSEEYNTGDPVVDVNEGEETFITLCNQRDTGTIHVFKQVRTSFGSWWEPQADEQWSWNLAGDPTEYHWADSANVPTNVLQTITEDPNDFPAPEYSTEWSCYEGETLFSSGTGRSIDFTLTEDDQEIVCTFYNKETSGIHGQKWNDENGDGIWDEGEDALNGWNISLYQDDVLIDSILTQNHNDQDGWYWFDNLAEGTYEICETPQNGWAQTYPIENDGCHTIELPLQFNFETQGPPQLENSSCALSLDRSNQITIVENSIASEAMCNFGNKEVNVTLTLDKSNNQETSEGGDGLLEADETITYRIDWGVDGNSDATDVVLTDVIPTELNLNVASISNGGVWNEGTRTITWDFGTQTPGTTGFVTYTATVKTTVPDGTDIINVARLTASNSDPLFLESESAVEVNVPQVLGDETEPILTIEKSADVTTVNPNGSVTYTIVVKNTGDGASINTLLTDSLPAGFTFEDGSSTKTWNLGTMAAGTEQTVTFTVHVGTDLEAGDYINTATAKADNHGEVSDTASVTVKVPKVLGATTGASMSDYFIFISSIAVIIAGALLIAEGKRRKKELLSA